MKVRMKMWRRRKRKTGTFTTITDLQTGGQFRLHPVQSGIFIGSAVLGTGGSQNVGVGHGALQNLRL